MPDSTLFLMLVVVALLVCSSSKHARNALRPCCADAPVAVGVEELLKVLLVPILALRPLPHTTTSCDVCQQIKALEISENRWKPTKATDEEEKVYKAIKGLLNKLTLEKFDKLYQELLVIGIRCARLARVRGERRARLWVCGGCEDAHVRWKADGHARSHQRRRSGAY